MPGEGDRSTAREAWVGARGGLGRITLRLLNTWGVPCGRILLDVITVAPTVQSSTEHLQADSERYFSARHLNAQCPVPSWVGMVWRGPLGPTGILLVASRRQRLQANQTRRARGALSWAGGPIQELCPGTGRLLSRIGKLVESKCRRRQ
jgi:hypothetical protein